MSGTGAKRRSSRIPTSGSVSSGSSHKIKKPSGGAKLSSKDVVLKDSGSGQVVGQFNSIDTDGKTSEDKRVSDFKMNTLQAKHFNNGVIIGFPFSSINFDIGKEKEVSLPLRKFFSLEKMWVDSKIVKTQVKVTVKKSFALDINLSAVKEKLATTKTQVIRKLFLQINGFGGVTTPSKFEGIIRSTFTLSESMEKAVSLARENDIVINSDLKRQGVHSDWAVVIKEIPIDMPKEMIVAAVFEFGQVLAAKWSFLIKKDFVHVAKAVKDREMALLFTLLVGTIVHDLGNLLAGAGGKTCVINQSLDTGNRVHCAVVCFKNNEDLESAFRTKPVFGEVKLSWARLDLVQCEQCGKLGHSVLECDAEISHSPKLSKSFKKVVSNENCLQLAKLYAKKSVPISRPAVFGGKSWAQVVSIASLSNGPHFGSGFGSSPDVSGLVGHLSLAGPVSSILETRITSLERSLELLTDKVSSIIDKLDSLSLVPLALVSSSQSLVAPGSVDMKSGSDMVLDEPDSVVISPSLFKNSDFENGLLGVKVGGSRSFGLFGIREVRLDVCWFRFCGLFCTSINDLIWKIATYNVREMNNSAKQEDIIHWHRDRNNLVLIVTETKLKDKVRSWIASKFDGVWVFISGLNSGHLGSGVAIIINNSLAKHMCKVSEVLGHLISVKLLFRNKFLVSILGLYAGASALVHFSQANDVNALVASVVNESSFVVLGGNFNEDGLHRSTSFRKCGSLGLVNSFVSSPFVKVLTWSNSWGVMKTIDYLFVSPNLVNVIVDCDVLDVSDFFDTDHHAVFASIGLGGLLNTHLCSVRKQANKDHWKYNFKDAGIALWLRFRKATAVNAAMFFDDFLAARELSDLDAMWDIVQKTISFSVNEVFRKKWFKSYDGVFTKHLFRFHKLELLVFKLVKTSHSVDCDVFVSLLDTWELLDSAGAAVVRSLFLSRSPFDDIHSALSKAKKSYCASKLSELKCAKDLQIRSAIDKRMESFESNKGYTIRSVLERSFHKVVLDHLVVGDKLYLEPDFVKKKVDEIMKRWTCKRGVVLDIPENWSCQYWSLDYVFDGAFSDVISCVSFDEMSGVVSDLPDGKAAGLSGISNELWKHCDKSILDMLLVLINSCLCGESVPSAWKKAWILSDRISLACSKFDVLHGNNFSVLKGTTTQFPIFAIGSVIENALEKNQELWLVLQDMRKAYDLVSWDHLKKSLVRIKMCCRFIRFFGNIHGGRTNQIMTDFGLINGYHVHDSLNQEEVFSLLLWHIFYDPFLCEVKRQKSVYGYRLNSHFIAKTGHVESQAGLLSFFAAGAFTTTQHILDVDSEFFCINNISINNNKTVAIPINSRASAPSLFISGSSISIAKSGKSHCYLGIFVSSERLSKPSLAKTHSDVCFFINLVLRKAILDKQFLYLVLAVLYPIISYRTQFSFVSDALIHRGLKSKSGLPLDFPSDTIHHPSFYGLKSFAQIQSEIHFGFVVGYPCLPFSVSLDLSGSFLRQYGIAFVDQLHDCHGAMFDWYKFKQWKRLDSHGPTPEWFMLSVEFLSGTSSPCAPSPALVDVGLKSIFASPGFVLVHDWLSQVLSSSISVYMDGSLTNFGTENCTAGAGVFFSDIDLDLGVGVSGLLSSTLAEMQAIALALECVPHSSFVHLFSDSQAALDVYKSELGLVCSDFHNCCWVEHQHIVNVIHGKNLMVEWHKVKGHSGVIGNKYADAIAGASSHSGWFLPSQLHVHFLLTDGGAVFGNFRHFVCDIFHSISCTHWEVGSGSKFLPASLFADIDWSCFSLVWHPNSHMAAGHTGKPTVDAHSFFMKALHHWLPVAVHKCLYNRKYPSVLCLYCDEVETSDHAFSCKVDDSARLQILDTCSKSWRVLSGLSLSSSCMLQLLFSCASDVSVFTALFKGFVFSGWLREAVSAFKSHKIVSSNIVEFVRSLSFAFRNDIWLVQVKHHAFMEKNKLIPLDGSVLVSVSGLASKFLAGIVRLLGVAEALGICFGFRKQCFFFSGVGNSVLVHIAV
ncbi:hypothetical protein G9A89_005625 [Geosiphon pyriformis]|nr:hypothetical protein G9A89_005625 [Geosiphon pyriformis]